MKFTCPSCGQSLEADDDTQGMQLECPSCNKPFVVPSIPAAIPVSEPTAVQPPPLPSPRPASASSDSTRIESQADKKEGRTFFQRLGRGVYITVMILVLAIAGTIGKELANEFFPATPARKSTFTPSWRTQQWGRMLIDSPSEITPHSVKMSPQQRSAMREVVEEMETGKMTTGSFELAVSRASYRNSITPNLDGAAQGSVAQIAALPGVSKPVHRITRTTVSGLAARRIEFTAERQVGSQSATLRVDGLVVLRGQESYAIQCIYQEGDETAAGYAMRILRSVRFQQ